MQAVLSREPEKIDSAPLKSEFPHNEAACCESKQARARTSPRCPYNCPRSLNIGVLEIKI